MEVNGAPELLCFPHFSEYLPLWWAEQRHSYRFGTTWGWVNDDRIFIFGWTIPLRTHRKPGWSTKRSNFRKKQTHSMHPKKSHIQIHDFSPVWCDCHAMNAGPTGPTRVTITEKHTICCSRPGCRFLSSNNMCLLPYNINTSCLWETDGVLNRDWDAASAVRREENTDRVKSEKLMLTLYFRVS